MEFSPSQYQLPHGQNTARGTIEWHISPQLVAYTDAVVAMEERVALIQSGHASELIWLLEHPPLYTAGTSAKASGLLEHDRFPVHTTGRGGQHTYHGPGQLIAYVMLDLKSRATQNTPDLRHFVYCLEQWLINSLHQLGINGERREGRVGIWVKTANGEAKIAALGIRVRKWITYHGVALNIAPDLEHFSGIVPCGIKEHGVTSLAALGVDIHKDEVITILKKQFSLLFG